MNKNILSSIFIILSGEAIFMLPFLIPRLYRPVMLEAWGITNTDLGFAFTLYGISSMISYILGGPFADKYSPRSLISISLVVTSLAGIPLLLFPSALTLALTYLFLGVSTIFLMWGALIKVTHISGGEERRSSAMGVLDAGRGLFAAIISTFLVFLVSLFIDDSVLSTQSSYALNIIYSAVIIITLLTSVGLWFTLKDVEHTASENKWSFSHALEVLRNYKVWLLGIIVLSAYCGYKSVDNYSLYLVKIQNFSLAQSAKFTSFLFWLRPLSALLAGVVADKFHQRTNKARFATMALLLFISGASQFVMAYTTAQYTLIILSNITISAFVAYALRAIYFSIFGDLKIPDHLVGTTVGIVSFVGFLPDMFFGLVTGHFIDSHQGITGFKHTFLFTSLLLSIGGVACVVLLLKNSAQVKSVES